MRARALLVGGRHFSFPPAEERKRAEDPTERPKDEATGGHCLPKHSAMSLFAPLVQFAAGQTGNTGQFNVVHAHKLTQI